MWYLSNIICIYYICRRVLASSNGHLRDVFLCGEEALLKYRMKFYEAKVVLDLLTSELKEASLLTCAEGLQPVSI